MSPGDFDDRPAGVPGGTGRRGPLRPASGGTSWQADLLGPHIVIMAVPGCVGRIRGNDVRLVPSVGLFAFGAGVTGVFPAASVVGTQAAPGTPSAAVQDCGEAEADARRRRRGGHQSDGGGSLRPRPPDIARRVPTRRPLLLMSAATNPATAASQTDSSFAVKMVPSAHDHPHPGLWGRRPPSPMPSDPAWAGWGGSSLSGRRCAGRDDSCLLRERPPNWTAHIRFPGTLHHRVWGIPVAKGAAEVISTLVDGVGGTVQHVTGGASRYEGGRRGSGVTREDPCRSRGWVNPPAGLPREAIRDSSSNFRRRTANHGQEVSVRLGDDDLGDV